MLGDAVRCGALRKRPLVPVAASQWRARMRPGCGQALAIDNAVAIVGWCGRANAVVMPRPMLLPFWRRCRVMLLPGFCRRVRLNVSAGGSAATAWSCCRAAAAETAMQGGRGLRRHGSARLGPGAPPPRLGCLQPT